jgi:hypothetical protein
MVNPFVWLRRKAAEAVVLGTADGLRAVTPDGEEPPADLGELRALLAGAGETRALPPAAEPEAEPAKAGRKK